MQSRNDRLVALMLVGVLLVHPGAAMSARESARSVQAEPAQDAPAAPSTSVVAPLVAPVLGIAGPFVAPTPVGPVFPPPTGVSYAGSPADGSYIAKTGGRNLVFTQTQSDRYTALYWGPRDRSAVQHSLVGGSLGPSSVLTLDVAQSNLPGGIGRWFGASYDPFTGGLRTTRFSLATTGDSGALPMISAADVGIANASAVVTVTGNFTANLLFEVDVGGFVGSNTYYDSYCMPGGNPACAAYFQPILSSFYGSFWYTAPDVGLSMSGSLCARQTGIFSVTVVNNGPGPVTGLVVTDVVPAGLTFNSYVATQGVYSPTTGLWTVGSVPEGGWHTLTLVTNVSGSGTFTNTASTSQYQIDPNSTNNSARRVVDTSRCLFIPSTQRGAGSGW